MCPSDIRTTPGVVMRPVISVAELDRRLKGAVESATGREWIQGEVSGLRLASSGHAYFTLKDQAEDAVIDVVMYRLAAQRARKHLVEGQTVQLFGRATLWAPRGRLQLVADALQPVGRGALLVALEALKARLHAEGLFSAQRKRPLPARPRCVGVITSGQGAAFRDIRAVIHRRARTHIVLVPALVQGDGAVASLLAAIELIERHPLVDLLIIGRGGGSLEDLMAFNDERLVRRLAAARIPVISAVGHEIDTCLCDLVADRRAATPSEAAELAVPDERVLHERLASAKRDLWRAFRRRLDEDRAAQQRLTGKLSDPRFLIAQKQQDLDELTLQLERIIRKRLVPARARVAFLDQRLGLRHPRVVLAAERARFVPLETRLRQALRNAQAARRQHSERLRVQLEALSPVAILARGYAIALDERGRALTTTAGLAQGAGVSVRLAHGRFAARVTETEPS